MLWSSKYSLSKSETFHASYCWWKKSCTSWYGKYQIIYKVLYIPGGAGFFPSTVLLAEPALKLSTPPAVGGHAISESPNGSVEWSLSFFHCSTQKRNYIPRKLKTWTLKMMVSNTKRAQKTSYKWSYNPNNSSNRHIQVDERESISQKTKSRL